jgi:endonuclease-3
VNEVTPQLFLEAPTPAKLAAMSHEHLLSLIRTVGLAPTKAKNLLKCAQRLVDNFDGVVPTNFADLESLAGVGHKTASCVMSQAFGECSFAVDTHIDRLAKRWHLVSEKANVAAVEKSFKELFPPANWGKLHLQLIYFGREWCPAKNHLPSQCPICSVCSKSTGPFTPHSPEAIAKCFVRPKKASKNIILYSERHLELAAKRVKLETPRKCNDSQKAALVRISPVDTHLVAETKKRPKSAQPPLHPQQAAPTKRPRRAARRLL